MLARSILGLTVSLLLVVGCGGAEEPTAPQNAPALQWESMASVRLLEGGASELLQWEQVPHGRLLAMKVIPVAPHESAAIDDVCFQLTNVRANGELWVGENPMAQKMGEVSSEGVHRVQSAPRLGTFLFPASDALGERIELLTFVVESRQCSTGYLADRVILPQRIEHVQWSVATLPKLGAERQPVLNVSPIVLANAYPEFATETVQEWLQDIFAVADQRFSQMGLELQIQPVVFSTNRALNPLVFGGEGYPELDTVQAALHAGGDAWEMLPGSVPVVVVPCLNKTAQGFTSTRLAGFVPRVPGGLADPSVADSVFISSGACDGQPPELSERLKMGQLLAHEIGHFLGLHHSDSPAGSHLATEGSDLMDSQVAHLDQLLQFTQAQGTGLLNHPFVY